MSSKSLNCIIISLFAFLFVSCASLPGGNKSQFKFNKKYQTIEVDEKLDYLDSKIKYPQFENYPELNKRIENTVLNNWKSFKTYSKSEWNEIIRLNNRGSSKLPPFEYLVNYEVSGNRDNISIILNTYIYNGGAHGNTSLTTFNYDCKEKKYIDILTASDMTYNEISSVCRNQLYKKLIEDNKEGLPPAEKDSMREMINTGAFPQAGNFELFTIDGSRLYVWFEPYSVAPYSYGVQKIQVK